MLHTEDRASPEMQRMQTLNPLTLLTDIEVADLMKAAGVTFP